MTRGLINFIFSVQVYDQHVARYNVRKIFKLFRQLHSQNIRHPSFARKAEARGLGAFYNKVTNNSQSVKKLTAAFCYNYNV